MNLSLFVNCLSGLLLAGCVAAGPPAAVGPDACHASELQGLVGQPGAVLATMRLGQPLRVIRFGMAVTMDYDPARLNISLDRQERIERVNCG